MSKRRAIDRIESQIFAPYKVNSVNLSELLDFNAGIELKNMYQVVLYTVIGILTAHMSIFTKSRQCTLMTFTDYLQE